MPKMIPDPIPDHADSKEKTIFDTLKHDLRAQADDWTVFHSIPVPQREDPANSRVINFVILIPDAGCVICLFIIRSQDSVFEKIKEKFHFRSSIASSLNLAQDIMEDLRSRFEASHFRDESPLSLGCAIASVDDKVIVPNGEEPYEYSYSLVDSLLDYVVRLPGVSEKLGYRDPEVEKALKELQSDLDPTAVPTTMILETSRQRLLELTIEQHSSLKHTELNDRCVIDGAAGTGKTILAKELARRRCEEKGNTVGLLCSNRYLIYDFEEWAATISNEKGGRIIVGTPSTLPGKIFEEDSTLSERHKQRLNDDLEQTLRLGALNDGWETFIEETVKDLQQIIDNTDTDTAKRGIFDYLIVDEAQNLCDDVFLNLMDALLKGGLVDGHWTMFGDFIYQDIVTLDRHSDGKRGDGKTVLGNFRKALHWSNDELETNCRNTQEISDAVENLLHITSLPRSGVHGPHVQIQLYNGLKQLNEMLNDSISAWSNAGFNSTDVMLLSSGTDNVFGDIVKEYGGKYGGWMVRSLHEFTQDHRRNSPAGGDSSQDNAIRYSDVYDYQGLESNFVILVMPKTPDSVELAGGVFVTQAEHLDRVIYTGMSRAHTMLIILADGSYETILRTKWPDYNW